MRHQKNTIDFSKSESKTLEACELQTQYSSNTSTVTKCDAIVAASTQLVKVLQSKISANIGKQEQLTRLATIFHTAATRNNHRHEKQSNIIQYNQVQPRVFKMPKDPTSKSLHDPEKPPRVM